MKSEELKIDIFDFRYRGIITWKVWLLSSKSIDGHCSRDFLTRQCFYALNTLSHILSLLYFMLQVHINERWSRKIATICPLKKRQLYKNIQICATKYTHWCTQTDTQTHLKSERRRRIYKKRALHLVCDDSENKPISKKRFFLYVYVCFKPDRLKYLIRGFGAKWALTA